MSEVERPAERAGTWRDWPVGLIAAGAVCFFIPGAEVFGGVMFWAGIVALLIRRGAFTPRR